MGKKQKKLKTKKNEIISGEDVVAPGGMSRERFVPVPSAGRSDGSGGCDPRHPPGPRPGSRSAPPRSNSAPLKFLPPLALTMRLDLWREMF